MNNNPYQSPFYTAPFCGQPVAPLVPPTAEAQAEIMSRAPAEAQLTVVSNPLHLFSYTAAQSRENKLAVFVLLLTSFFFSLAALGLSLEREEAAGYVFAAVLAAGILTGVCAKTRAKPDRLQQQYRNYLHASGDTIVTMFYGDRVEQRTRNSIATVPYTSETEWIQHTNLLELRRGETRILLGCENLSQTEAQRVYEVVYPHIAPGNRRRTGAFCSRRAPGAVPAVGVPLPRWAPPEVYQTAAYLPAESNRRVWRVMGALAPGILAASLLYAAVMINLYTLFSHPGADLAAVTGGAFLTMSAVVWAMAASRYPGDTRRMLAFTAEGIAVCDTGSGVERFYAASCVKLTAEGGYIVADTADGTLRIPRNAFSDADALLCRLGVRTAGGRDTI